MKSNLQRLGGITVGEAAGPNPSWLVTRLYPRNLLGYLAGCIHRVPEPNLKWNQPVGTSLDAPTYDGNTINPPTEVPMKYRLNDIWWFLKS